MPVRLNKVISELNVALDRIGKFLAKKGKPLEDASINAKISDEQYKLLAEEFGKDKSINDSTKQTIQERKDKERQKKADQKAKQREEEQAKQGVFRTDASRQKYTPLGHINDFNKAMADNKGVPSPTSNFISKDIQEVVNHFNFIKGNARITTLDYKEGVEDKVTILIENMTGRRALHQGERFPDAIRSVQNSVSDYVRATEPAFRDAYVPAMQALVAQAKEDAEKAQANPTAAAAEKPAPAASSVGTDAPLSLEIDPKTGLPKA